MHTECAEQPLRRVLPAGSLTLPPKLHHPPSRAPAGPAAPHPYPTPPHPFLTHTPLSTLLRRWEAETAALVKQHARGVEEVKADYERRLVEHEQHHAGLQEVGQGGVRTGVLPYRVG